MDDWLGLEGRGVLLAGAGGIGCAVAEGFVRAGARVLLADVDPERLRSAVEASGCAANGGGGLVLDATDPAACAAAVEESASRLGALDVLVHCIGINNRVPVLDLTEQEWRTVLDVNLSSAFWLGQAAGRLMCAQRHGRIVYFSSVSGLLAHKLHAPYAAGKGGMNQMLRVMAAEWASAGVGVNAVAPGYTETELTAEYLARPGTREDLERLVPAGWLGGVDELVGPALFLASDRARYVTGHVLYVDGGRTLT